MKEKGSELGDSVENVGGNFSTLKSLIATAPSASPTTPVPTTPAVAMENTMTGAVAMETRSTGVAACVETKKNISVTGQVLISTPRVIDPCIDEVCFCCCFLTNITLIYIVGQGSDIVCEPGLPECVQFC